MNRYLILLLHSLLTICTVLDGQGQTVNSMWNPPTVQKLSNNYVSAFAEDGKGYIWIGTRKGLNRYNGSTFKVFYQSDSTSLASDRIISLCADTEDRLWVGTDSGINLIQDSKVIRRSENGFNPINALINLNNRYLLYSNNDGLLLYHKRTGTSKLVYSGHDLSFASQVLATTNSTIWACPNNALSKIIILNADFNKIDSIRFEPNIFVNGLVETESGFVYVATNKGLKKYAVSDGSEAYMSQELLEMTKNRNILFTKIDPKYRHILIGIEGLGLFDIDKNDKIQSVWTDESLQATFSCLCLLTNNNIWLSKNRNNFVVKSRNYDQKMIAFTGFRPNEMINRIFRAENEMILVVTNHSVFIVNTTDRGYRNITPVELKESSQIEKSFFDSNENLWLVHDLNKLTKYRLQNNQLLFQSTYPVSKVSCIWEDNQKRINLLLDGEIRQISPEGEASFQHISNRVHFWDCSTVSRDNSVKTTFFFSDFSIYSQSSSLQFIKLPIEVPAPNSICEDSKGNLWIGTFNRGLFHFNPTTQKLTAINRNDGLPDNSIRSVVADGTGIWASMRNEIAYIALSDFRISTYIPGTQKEIDFISNSGIRKRNGNILLAGLDKLVEITPQVYESDKVIPLIMDAILVNNVEREPAEQIVLSHNQNQLSFYFSGMDYEFGPQLNYAYMLEGYDRNWIFSGAHQRAGYSNLPCGSYIFKVKVRTVDGKWSKNMLVQRIKIKPSPWLSLPAYFAYACFILISVYLIILQVIRNKRNKDKIELAEYNRLLTEQLSRSKTDFFTNISHEYRTPLSLIYGPIKDLAANNSFNQHDTYLISLIERNADRLLKLTDQVLNFSKFDKSENQLHVLKTDLAGVILSITDNFEYLLQKKQLTMEKLFPTEAVMVYCDTEKIEKILFNLISNAVKYTPEKGQIQVKVENTGREAKVTVSDTGFGIAPEEKLRIFERFKRLDQKNGSTNGSDGYGIGLNYAMHLAQLHKGTLRVTDNFPRGTVFSFIFPSDKDSYTEEELWDESLSNSFYSPSEHSFSDADVKDLNKDITILVVEDNVDMRTYIRDFLKETYNVVTAGDGDEAWKCIRISIPDLIVSDIMMPYKDGFALCSEIKNDAEYCHLPVILLTAKSDVENQIHGLQIGADAYIKKPFEPAFFLATIHNLLENRLRVQHVLRERTSDSSTEAISDLPINNHDRVFLEKLYKLVDTHLGDEQFNVTSIAIELHMSRSSLFSKLKVLTGESPRTFLTNYRLNRAMELLKTHEYNVSEVAYRVGFDSLNGLSRAFKNKFGVSPSSI